MLFGSNKFCFFFSLVLNVCGDKRERSIFVCVGYTCGLPSSLTRFGNEEIFCLIFHDKTSTICWIVSIIIVLYTVFFFNNFKNFIKISWFWQSQSVSVKFFSRSACKHCQLSNYFIYLTDGSEISPRFFKEREIWIIHVYFFYLSALASR